MRLLATTTRRTSQRVQQQTATGAWRVPYRVVHSTTLYPFSTARCFLLPLQLSARRLALAVRLPYMLVQKLQKLNTHIQTLK